MAILRRRRGRSSGSTEPPRQPPPPPAAPKLEDRLEAIAASTAPEDALDPALQAILEATNAHAGALCLFDARHQLMRLATEVGLSEEGCARLRSVRRGDPASWDMPLHGLLNRRAYLIESAPRNRYVPPLIEDASAVRSVACVPVYGATGPLGSVVLVSLGPRSFAERDIHALERGLRELAKMIEAARRRGGTVDEPAPAPVLRPLPAPAVVAELEALSAERDRLRGEIAARQAERASLAADLAARAGESERLRVALDAANDERVRLTAEIERGRREAERAVSLTASLATAERERARLAEALEAAAGAHAEQTQATIALELARANAEQAAVAALADLETTRRVLGESASAATARAAQLESDVASLTARLAESEAAVAQERGRAQEREREEQRLAGELHGAGVREQQLRAELRAARERSVADGEDELRRALDAVRGSEDARSSALAELEAARQALASSQEIVLALEDEAGYAHLEIERLGGVERSTGIVQERLEEEIATLRAQSATSAARLGATERELETLRQERSRLVASAREREAEGASRSARVETLAAERDRLQEALAEAVAERDRLLADASAGAGRHGRLEESLAAEMAERTRLGAALGDVQSALGALEAAHARTEAELAARTAEAERLRTECEQLRQERDRAASGGGVPVVTDEPTPIEPVRVVTVAVGGGRARTRELEPAADLIAVIDIDHAWTDTHVDGHRVSVVPPSADVADRLAEPAPSRIVANLAAPGTFEALVALRATGSQARVWGCLASANGERVLPLGMIEPAVRPLDPDAILAVLAGYAIKGTRVITAGADVDALMSLRQALARQGMSVSMAWDAKQASDLLGVVRPEVVVVDLALPRRDGYAIVAALAHVDPVPSAILLPGEGDLAAAFAGALADPAHARRATTRRTLLTRALGGSEATPVERRHKIRAIGRGK